MTRKGTTGSAKIKDAWKRIAETYNRAAETSKKAGIQFVYHNHNFEFAPRADLGGKLPYDFLLESCDPSLVAIIRMKASRAAPHRPTAWSPAGRDGCSPVPPRTASAA